MTSPTLVRLLPIHTRSHTSSVTVPTARIMTRTAGGQASSINTSNNNSSSSRSSKLRQSRHLLSRLNFRHLRLRHARRHSFCHQHERSRSTRLLQRKHNLLTRLVRTEVKRPLRKETASIRHPARHPQAHPIRTGLLSAYKYGSRRTAFPKNGTPRSSTSMYMAHCSSTSVGAVDRGTLGSCRRLFCHRSHASARPTAFSGIHQRSARSRGGSGGW